MKKPTLLIVHFAMATLLAAPAHAAFHLMKIVEVFPGTQASPSAQYIVLQMYAAGQNLVSGHPVTVYDASGALVATYTFPGNVASGANQAKILVGTAEAASFFGVAVNLTMTSASISPAAGKVCFDTIDCVAWGNYTGSLTGVGTPFQNTSGGLRLGRAALRRLNIAGGAGTLDAGDDTDNSSNDFIFGTPAPRNNAGVNGTIPTATCGNSTIEGLEACDDGDTTGGDGCRADCAGLELCGDLLLDTLVGETCDDGNTVGGDSCPANCGVPAPAVPDETSPLGDLAAIRGLGTSVDVSYEPACSATDHAAYWGVGPIVDAVSWSSATCGLGTTGSAVFDPGDPPAGQFVYFVVVGYTEADEGSYGFGTSGERAEAVGVGACDRPVGEATCP